MREFMIRFRSFQEIQEFVTLATAQGFPIYVGTEAYRVSATSLMGMFSLDYSRPIRVSADCTEDQWTRFSREAQRLLDQ